MALTYTNFIELGTPAPEFSLLGTDGSKYTLENFSSKKALLVIFMCNHCPYVIAVQDRVNDLAKTYGPKGVGFIAINSNDVVSYPEDNMENMKIRAKELGYVFPYVLDETQEVAKAYQAQCTPDPYLFSNESGKFLLRYQGRIDNNWKEEDKVTVKDLANAMDAILEGRQVSKDQNPAMGCSIKWKK